MNSSKGETVEYQNVREVLTAFGAGKTLTIHPAGGTASPKWAVCSDKGRFVVRVRPAEFAELPSIRFDHQALELLSGAGLPVPAPLALPGGATWLSRAGKMYEVLQWVEGRPFDEHNLDAVAGVGAFLARFHDAIKFPPSGKAGWLREDHPDLMEPYLARLRELVASHDDRRQLDRLARELDYLREHLSEELYGSLPHCVIHGDVHPGNVRFRDSVVTAVYDFDYLGVQARARDVSDGLIFFAAKRDEPLIPSDIRSLTQPFFLDSRRCRALLRGYQRSKRLTEEEWQALPLLMRSRWLQMRLRGSRKVPEHERVAFVLDDFFAVSDWFERESPAFFEMLRRAT